MLMFKLMSQCKPGLTFTLPLLLEIGGKGLGHKGTIRVPGCQNYAFIYIGAFMDIIGLLMRESRLLESKT